MASFASDEVRIALHQGPREDLRELFELAEDSPSELASYMHAGRVLVAVGGSGQVVGHLQLVAGDEPGQMEIKSLAVRQHHQGRGLGTRLVGAAIELAAAESATLLLVSTATASVGNLRFYQRRGFRMRSIERDAFGPATGYPPGITIDGIPLRDRVWLDQAIGTAGVT